MKKTFALGLCILFLGFGIGIGMIIQTSYLEVREQVLREQIDKYVGYSVDLAVCEFIKDRLEEQIKEDTHAQPNQ